jgi:DtxR family Mn-dependent transcriptional regulator
MLGRPDVDPHGDPIPTAQGKIARPDYPDLLGAPIGVPLVVTRIIDQDASFLRFVEQHGLMPGRSIRIESRDGAADAVAIVNDAGQVTTIGARAASKVLARTA